MFLYHFSEDPDITIFEPRLIEGREDPHPWVWAIDDEHAVNYFFPRECPRIIYSWTESMDEGDRVRFFSNTLAKTIITVESAWLAKINRTTLYKYTFADDSFELMDETAGYYVSKQTVAPLQVEPIVNMVEEVLKRQVELRFTPNLYPLRDAIIGSALHDFSMIRFRNAQKP